MRLPRLAGRVVLAATAVAVSLALAATPAWGQEASAARPARPSGYVADEAGALNAGTQADLDAQLADYESRTTNEIAVAIVRTTGSEPIEDYASALFREWEVGQQGVDNGVLLVVAVDDRRVRLQTGSGVEGALPDSRAQEIVDAEILPRFRSGDLDGGVRAGVIGVRRALGDDVSSPDRGAEPTMIGPAHPDAFPSPGYDSPAFDPVDPPSPFGGPDPGSDLGPLVILAMAGMVGVGVFQAVRQSADSGFGPVGRFGSDRCPRCQKTMAYAGRVVDGGRERVSEYRCSSCDFVERRVRGGSWGGGSVFGSMWAAGRSDHADDSHRSHASAGFSSGSSGSSGGGWSGSAGSGGSSGAGGGGSSSGGGASGSW